MWDPQSAGLGINACDLDELAMEAHSKNYFALTRHMCMVLSSGVGACDPKADLWDPDAVSSFGSH